MKISDDNTYFLPMVDEAWIGTRLDKFLSQNMPDLSRSMVQKLINGGNVSLDENVITENDFKVRKGDGFCVVIPEAEEAEPQPEEIKLDVVYEDDDLIVVNKPAGMTVHPAPGARDRKSVV